MLTLGATKVIGDSESLFNYLVNTDAQVNKHFCHEPQLRKISLIMTYFSRTIRRVTAKLIQAVVDPKFAEDDKKRKRNDARISQHLTDFFGVVLNNIDDYLTDMGFMTGPHISVVDIMVYCEIFTICELYRREVPAHLTKLSNWFELLSKEEALQRVNGKFKELVAEHKLHFEPAGNQ